MTKKMFPHLQAVVMHPVTFAQKYNTTEHTPGKDLRPEVRDTATDSVNSIELSVSLTSGINGTNSVAGSTTSTTHAPPLPIQQSEVGILYDCRGDFTCNSRDVKRS